ncbi:MAG: metallophosphoesterase [Hyphomicrobiaceae bacterium]
MPVETTTLAHLSDVHLTPLVGFTPRHWNVKRTLGVINWHRGRRRVHRPDVVDSISRDIALQNPDHIAVTGDLCNVGLPGEYSAALAWLETIGPPGDVSVVPGNHDIYSHLKRHDGVEMWRAYMRSDAFGRDVPGEAAGPRAFPYVRRVGCMALIGVNSAVETPPFVAAGEVGTVQRSALARVLDHLRSSGLARIVLIHHPPLPGQAPPRRGLKDAGPLEEVLAEHGAELVLHGHNHRDSIAWCHSGAGAPVPVVGIASGSAGRRHGNEPLARYNLVRVHRDEAGEFAIEITGRGITAAQGPVGEIERKRLSPGAAS